MTGVEGSGRCAAFGNAPALLPAGRAAGGRCRGLQLAATGQPPARIRLTAARNGVTVIFRKQKIRGVTV